MNIKIGSDLYTLAWLQIDCLKEKQLFYFLGSKDSVIRSMAVQKIQLLPSHHTFKMTTQLLYNARAQLRESGYLILGQLGTPERPFKNESIPYILNGLANEKRTTVQCAIACAIGHLQPPIWSHSEIIKGFYKYLDYDKESIREMIAFGISGLSDSKELNRLIKRLLNKAGRNTKEWLEVSLDIIRKP